MKFRHSMLVLTLLLTPAESALGEQHTDRELHYSFDIPEGWIQIPGNVIEETFRSVAEQAGAAPEVYVAGYQVEAQQYFELPYLLVQHLPAAASSRQISEVLSSATLSDAVQDHPATSLYATGVSLGEPSVDPVRKMVLTTMEGQLKDVGPIKSSIAVAPGRDRAVGIYLYSRASEWERDLPLFEDLLDSFRFVPGYEYDWAASLAASTDWSSVAGQVIGAAVVFAAVGTLLYRRRRKKRRD